MCIVIDTPTPTHKHSCVVPRCPQLCTCYECTQKRMRTHIARFNNHGSPVGVIATGPGCAIIMCNLMITNNIQLNKNAPLWYMLLA